MGSSTFIGWTDFTLNPVDWRCAPVVDECLRCYAETFTDRWQGPGAFRSGPPALKPGRLLLPWLDPKMRAQFRCFLMSMSDPFHPGIPIEDQVLIWAMMAADPGHEYQVLSKRPDVGLKLLTRRDFPDRVRDGITVLRERMTPRSGRLNSVRRAALESMEEAADAFTWPLPNVLVGVSVGQQSTADKFVPKLLAIPAARRFLSVEPLIGPVDLCGPVVPGRGRPRLTYWLDGRPGWGPERTTETGLVFQDLAIGPRIDWVIIGGESGRVNTADPFDAPKESSYARPMDLAWARAVKEQCEVAGVPVFVKQLGSVQSHVLGGLDFKGEDWDRWPAKLEDLKVRRFPKEYAA